MKLKNSKRLAKKKKKIQEEMKIKNKVNVERTFMRERERERERLLLLVQDSYNEFKDKHSGKEEKRKLNAKKNISHQSLH